MIDREGTIPLYQQLIDVLRGALLCGDIQPGGRIPTESELSAQYQVSRITVRKAIEVLAEEGLVVKKQGKGTFAEKPKFERKIIDPVSFSASCTYKGMRPGSKLLQRLFAAPIPRKGKAWGWMRMGRSFTFRGCAMPTTNLFSWKTTTFPSPNTDFCLIKTSTPILFMRQ